MAARLPILQVARQKFWFGKVRLELSANSLRPSAPVVERRFLEKRVVKDFDHLSVPTALGCLERIPNIRPRNQVHAGIALRRGLRGFGFRGVIVAHRKIP
jgi:hypothetical protein